MEKFEIDILGCGAALPTPKHMSSTQVVNVRDKIFLLDCAEGCQMSLRRTHIKFSRIQAIFITHLHGDHCFGLIGLLSTLGLLGRTQDLHVYAPCGLAEIYQPQIDFFCSDSPFKIFLHEIDSKKPSVIYDDRSVEISTIPLSHRVPCCGYLFREKPTLLHIKRDVIDAFNIPISQINNIKAGLDWISPDGEVIKNSLLTLPAEPTRSYAYCTDTMYSSHISDLLKDTTCIYHEATFTDEHSLLAKKTAHSTAKQAAQTALEAHTQRLIIGHFSSRYKDESILLKEASSIFPNTELAYDGMKIKL